MLAGWPDVFCLLPGASSKIAVRVVSGNGTKPIRREGTRTDGGSRIECRPEGRHGFPQSLKVTA